MFKDWKMSVSIIFLLTLSVVILKSIVPSIFPLNFIYLALAIIAFWIFSNINFEILAIFSKHFYIISVLLLTITLVIGSVTRGTIRWIPVGPLSIQPAEIVRPFLLVFFADYVTKKRLNFKRVIWGMMFLFLPVILILVQPSLGVSIMTAVGFFGVLISGNYNKKYVLSFIVLGLILLPIAWFLMKPYQKERILNFGKDYNTAQSIIGVGSGKFFGNGLGKGVQTQLEFLPEKQTDFIFSAVSEELGFLGASFMLISTSVLLLSLVKFMENSVNPAGRAYLAGFTLIYLAQVFVHAGMNMGMLPVTGLPFPLVSAGGSSLLATMTSLGIALGAYKKV